MLLQVLEHMTCYAFPFQQSIALPKTCLLVVSRCCSLLPKSLCQTWIMTKTAFTFVLHQAYWSWLLLPRQKTKRLLAAKIKNPAGETRSAKHDGNYHASCSTQIVGAQQFRHFVLFLFLFFFLCFSSFSWCGRRGQACSWQSGLLSAWHIRADLAVVTEMNVLVQPTVVA